MKSFTANDITGDDIVFDVESETVDSITTRKAMAEDLLRLGVFNDENGKISDTARLKLLEIMGFGNWENAADIADCQRDAAIRENAAVKEDGKRPEITDVDDDNLHVEEHTKALLSDGLNARAKKALTEHVKEHKQRLLLSAATSTGEEGNGQE